MTDYVTKILKLPHYFIKISFNKVLFYEKWFLLLLETDTCPVLPSYP